MPMPPPKTSSKLPPIPEPLNEDEEEEEVEYLLEPPDGGWGWVIVISVFYCNLISDGIMLSFGTFLQIIAEDFNVDKASVALIGSLMYGVYLIMGPVCAGFSNVFGLRPVAVVGSVISALGLVISFFSPWYEFLYFSYGLLGGIGLGLIYMNGLIMTALYFSKLRALAIAVTTTGTGFGSIIFPFVANYMLKRTTWRVAFMLEAGMAASMFFACLTFRPLKPKKVLTTTTPDAVTIMSKARSTRSRVGSITSFGTRRTTIYVKRPAFPHTDSVVSALTMHTMAMEHIATQMALSQIMVRPCLPQLWDRLKKCFQCICRCKCKCNCNCKCRRKDKDTSVVVFTTDPKSEYFQDDPASRNRNYSMVSGVPSRFITSVSMDSSTFLLSRLDLPPKNEIRHRRFCDCEPLRRTVKGMLDCRVMKNRSFVILCISSAFNMSAFLIIMTYQRDRAITMGFTEDMGTYLVMTTGASNTLWRLLFGLIAIIPGINNYYLSLSAMSLGGIAAMISGLHPSLLFQFGMCFFMGLGMAVFAVLRPVILIELAGIDMIFSATGIILMIMGIASILGPPMGGGLMLLTNNYDVVFYLSGSMFTISGLMLLIIPPVRHWERNREDNF